MRISWDEKKKWTLSFGGKHVDAPMKMSARGIAPQWMHEVNDLVKQDVAPAKVLRILKDKSDSVLDKSLLPSREQVANRKSIVRIQREGIFAFIDARAIKTWAETHMVTSSGQYASLSPSHVIVLEIIPVERENEGKTTINWGFVYSCKGNFICLVIKWWF